MKKHLRYIFSALGILIFCVLIYRLGPLDILSHLTKVRWWIVPILAIVPIGYMLYTMAWNVFLKNFEGKISFLDLLKIKIAGEAVNSLTPVNFIIGDPARAHLLRHKFHPTESVASVVVDRTLNAIATLAIIIIGTTLAIVKLPLPKNIKYGLPAVLVVASLFIGFILVHQHRGLFSFLADLAKRFKFKKAFSPNTLERLAETDGHIANFYQTSKRAFWSALALHFGGRLLGVFEIFLIGWAINDNFTPFVAFLLGAAAPIINLVFAFIPGAFGVLEGALSAILYSSGFPPEMGVTIQIVRRFRAAIWIGVGLILLGRHERKMVLSGKEVLTY